MKAYAPNAASRLRNWLARAVVPASAGVATLVLALGPGARAADPEPPPDEPPTVPTVPGPVAPSDDDIPDFSKPPKDEPKPEPPAANPKTDRGPLAAKKDRARALVARAQELAAVKRYDEALDFLRDALEAYPAYPLAHHEVGVTLAEQGNLPAAEASLRKALEMAPDFARAKQALGEVLRRQKRFDEALPLLSAASQAQPKDLASWYGMAAIFKAQKKDAEALWALESLVGAAENPDAPVVNEARKEAAALIQKGVVASAWGVAPTVAEPTVEPKKPDDEESTTPTAPGSLPRHAGDKAFAEQRYLAALEAYNAAWNAKKGGAEGAPAPIDAVLAYKIGATWAVMNDRKNAMTWWRKALAAEPSRELVARHLALLIAAERGVEAQKPADDALVQRAKAALRAGDPGTALYLVHGVTLPGAALVEAEARLRLGDFARARALFEELLGDDPDDRLAQGGLAEALLKLGQTSLAESAIQIWVGPESIEGSYKARPETFVVLRRGELEARFLAPAEPND